MTHPLSTFIVISGTFLGALLLTLMPLPDWAVNFRPEWVAMILIYWTITLPRKVGIAAAWLIGLLVDVTKGALLGQYALALALVAFISVRLHERIRVSPLWQQAVTVAGMLAPYMALILWTNGIAGKPIDSWFFWGPLVTSALLWPWLSLFLSTVFRRTVSAP